MSIIGSVVWNPQKPTAGQSVKVDVCGPDGKPYANNEATHIGINGAAGSEQYLQFPFAGDQQVFVTAMAPDGTREERVVTITVAAAEPSPATLATISDPLHSALTKDLIAWMKVTADISLLTNAPALPYSAPYNTQLSVVSLSRFVQRPPSPAPTIPAPPSTATLAATPVIVDTWAWDFGDGTTATTDSPSVRHDFESVLGTTREFQQFHVNVTGTRSIYPFAASQSLASTSASKQAPTSITALGSWTRTLSVHNTYVTCKNRGYVVLPVTAGGWATKSGTNFVGDAEIKNNEPVAIQLTSRRLIPVLEDPNATVVPAAVEAVNPPVIVPAKGRMQVKVVAPFSLVPDGALGFSAVYSAEPATGSANPIAGLKVRATAHLLVEPQYRGKAAPAATPAANPATPARVDKLGPGPDRVPSNEVMPPVAEGNQCDPDNLPEHVPAGLACQITPRTQTVQIAGRFLNARKGDILLSPSVGGASLAVALLTPPQLYGHSGIMTRNYEQITHCTPSQGRVEAYTVGGSLSSNDDGFDPDALKYVWPGVLTQTVDNAVNGEMIVDPSSTTGKTYTFQDFNGMPSALNVGGQFVVIPPLVVKPDPMLETSAVRDLLTKVADDAFSNTGHFHYRFYCFTDPAASLNDGLMAPKTGLNASSMWAAGTRGAVCSSFIWLMMKGRGVNALGPSKYATEAELSPAARQLVTLDPDNQTLDGLFYYSAQQRSTCASWLYNKVWGFVRAQESAFDEAITQAANYYADQVCNTFATDDSSTPNEGAGVKQPWLTLNGGDTITPDDFLAWNGPGPQDGVLGYSEPAIYFPANTATVPVYTWAKVTQYGKLSGQVTLNGKPAASVTVAIPSMTTGTDKDGHYSFEKVPFGPYLVKAQLAWTEGPVADGLQTGVPEYAVGQASLKVDRADVTADIKVKPPNQPWDRQIAIKGYASLDCSEWPDHYTSYPQIEDWVDVGRGNVLASWTRTEVSKDATAVFMALVTWKADDSVDLVFAALLDEPGGAASTFPAFNIPAGKSVTITVGNSSSWLNGRNGYVYNGTPDLEADNDTLLLNLTFTNHEWTA